MSVDWSQVEALADKFDLDASEIKNKVSKVVSKGAVNIKNDMRADAANSRHYKYFSRSISYDETDGGLGAEIGPDKALVQGSLGNILYFGTSNNAPVLDINSGLRREEPRFADNLANVAEDIL